jgi:hypothetical protein
LLSSLQWPASQNRTASNIPWPFAPDHPSALKGAARPNATDDPQIQQKTSPQLKAGIGERAGDQPADHPGALAEAPLLDGARFHVRQFGFDLFQHPGESDGERCERAV